MPNLPINSDQLDEQLTAYLDGELPPAEARQVEDMLADDQRARRRLNQLASSWDLLDRLPRAAVDENFTRSTVEMVALSTEEDIAQAVAAEPSRRQMRWLAAAVIALLAAGVGFTAVSVAMPKNNDALLRDLPVVANFELYHSVGSVELLRQLDVANVFPTEASLRVHSRPFGGFPRDRNDLRPEPEKPLIAVPSSIDNRRQWLQDNISSPEAKLELRRSFERFLSLPLAEQDSLRLLDSELNRAGNREQLARIMQRYNDWLSMLSTAQRGALEDLPIQKKMAEIERIKHDREQWFFGGNRLNALQEFAKRHEQELLKSLPLSTQQALSKMKGSDDHDRRRYFGRLAWDAMGNADVLVPLITEEDVPLFISQLSPDSSLRKQLNADNKQRLRLLGESIRSGAYVRELTSRGFGPALSGRRGSVRWQQLVRDLPENERKQLEGMSDSEKFQTLWRKFNAESIRFGPGNGRPPADDGRHGPRLNGMPRESFHRDQINSPGPPPDEFDRRSGLEHRPFAPPPGEDRQQ
ncbi:MAG: hypothetical protein IT427_00215 [Pirellulales bacterium]|nr:hypothetical protein [Pirellulales bacterium]